MDRLMKNDRQGAIGIVVSAVVIVMGVGLFTGGTKQDARVLQIKQDRESLVKQALKNPRLTTKQAEQCVLLSELAESMMNSRQSGVSLERTMQTWSSQGNLLPLIMRAYRTPQEATRESQAAKTREFSLNILEGCLAGN